MTHRTDPATGKPVCGGKGRTVDTNPTCLDCRDIERNYPRLLWTVQQHEDAAEMFVATFRGGK